MTLAATMPREEKSKFITKQIEIVERWLPRFTQATKEAFEQDKAFIEALIRDNQREALRRKALPNWIALSQQVAEYFAGASAENWQTIFAPVLKGVMGDAGDFWSAQLGVQFDVRNLEGELWFQQYVLQFAQPISQTSGEVLHDLIAQGLATDWTVDDLTNNMGLIFDQWINGNLSPADFEWLTQRAPVWRRETIARTETNRAYSTGTYELGRQWGVRTKEWSTSLDGRERETHHDADGQVRGINEPFDVGDSQLMHPHDTSLGADLSEVINCRCGMLLYK